jgi:hypothetical protein
LTEPSQLAREEAWVYDFHAEREHNREVFCWAMQYSIIQQTLQQDILLYLLAVLMHDDLEVALVGYPNPAYYVPNRTRIGAGNG